MPDTASRRLRSGKPVSDPVQPVLHKNERDYLTFEETRISVREVTGRRWISAREICSILGLSNPSATVRRLDDDEYCRISVVTAGGMQDQLFVSESGANHLTFISRKPVARRVRRWITGEVMPQISRTGGYVPGGGPAGAEPPTITGAQMDLLRRLSLPGPHMVFVMPGHEPYVEEVDPCQFIRDLDRHDVEGLVHAMNLIGSVWNMCRKIDGAMYCSPVLQSGIGRQLDDAIRIGVDLSRSVIVPAPEKP
ncbi:antirepressor [Komagataeibacter intermedius AF2]|uniref:Antirepressor n=1 Tax=Komagataeibacter intermedius AF2 TaxID=1458464 RepID=A0A0N1FDK0_9PROT|nr:Bro-N domain-containing protein [Komagataeibacter intermedius]KPH88751.1 antirepressor [Komagataeibacter intermedius AF2]